MQSKDLKDKRLKAAECANSLLFGDGSKCDADWKSDESECREEFTAILSLMSDMEAMGDDEEVLSLRYGGVNDDSPPVADKSIWLPLAMVASVCLIAIAVSLFYDVFSTENTIRYDRYVTKVGEQKVVSLKDGSTVTLNTGTRIQFSNSTQERKVILERGEAYFDIKSDEARPFTVDTGFRSITVLGTEFNVRKLPHAVQVAVTEGEILMHSVGEEASINSPLLSDATRNREDLSLRQRRISAGWMVEYNASTNTVSAQRSEDIDKIHLWRTGVLDFDGTPLVDVVKELNRYSGKKILIESGDIVDLKVFSVMHVDRVDLALDAIEYTLPVTITHHFDRIVLTRSLKK